MAASSKHKSKENSKMTKNKTVQKYQSKSKHKEKTVKESYKDGLLQIDEEEEKFDKLFEKKLAQQYQEFRLIKEHHLQIKKFVRIFAILITIILLALLLLSYTR